VGDRTAYAKNPSSRPMGIGLDLFGVKKDGTEFPVEVSLGNYQENNERFVIAFVNDITIRKNAEAEISKLNDHLEETVVIRTRELSNTLNQLAQSNENLETALAFQKAILDNAGVMLIVTDNEGVIRLFNPAAIQNTGYSEAEVVHKQTPLLLHTRGDIQRKREDLHAEFGVRPITDFDVIIEKARRNLHVEEEYSYTRKDGSVFPVSLTVTTIRDKQHQITGYMGVAVDISARKKAESDLLESLYKEKELSELKSRFVSMASHEFRTPLSTVFSSAYLVEKYSTTEEQPKREKHLQRIVSAVNMLTDILNDFLSVGKIEEGKIQVKPAEFNIRKLVSQVIQEMQPITKPDQELLYEHDGEEHIVLDPTLLKHIVMNLISNAIKFSPQGKPIQIKTEADLEFCRLMVKDSGIGISPDDQQHLMERFFRGANATNIQGTGLGLHIVAKYAELMNGTVECFSELERGTSFCITFKRITLLS
jgi:PAS domain S-box-containing protein